MLHAFAFSIGIESFAKWSFLMDNDEGGPELINVTFSNNSTDEGGGYTQTIPLLPGSSAIETGNNATCAAADQRGITRPQGAHCDIGAYEVGPNYSYLPLLLH
jgi:hypothetical protein